MFNIKELVSKITDKGIRPKAGDSSSGVVDHVEHLSAEGFLCPPCMKAFPSPEALEEHYIKTHPLDPATEVVAGDNDDIIHQDDGISEALMQEVLQLQLSDTVGYGTSLDSEDRRALEESNVALKQEIKSIRTQLRDETEQYTQLRKEQDLLKEKFLRLASQNDELAAENKGLCHQLDQRTNAGNDAIARQEEFENLQKSKDLLLGENKQQIENLTAQINQIRTEANEGRLQILAESERVKSQLEQEIRKTEEENTQLKNELSVYNEKIKRKEDEYLAVKIKLEEANDYISRHKDENSTEASKLEAEKSNIAKYVEELESLKRQVENVTAERDKVVQNWTFKLQNSQKELKEIQDKHAQEVKRLSEKINILESTLKQKENEVDSLKSQLQSVSATKDEEIVNLKTILSTLESEKVQQKQTIEELKQERNNLQKSLTAAEASSSHLKQDVTKTKAEIETLEKKIANLLKDLQSKESVEQNMKKELEQISISSAEKLSNLESLMQERNKKINLLEEEKASLEQSYQAVAKTKEDEAASLSLLLAEKSKEVEQLSEALKNSQEIAAVNASKAAVLEDRINEMDALSNELKFKLKSNEEEKALLADRCLAEQSKAESCQQAYDECKRKLDDSVSALHELGRENQSLQMESAKLQGRKWADDSLATNCTSCSKEFSLTVRKHHCRHCGQIFCNDCSSRSASVPSSKKPVRVCDACYQELEAK